MKIFRKKNIDPNEPNPFIIKVALHLNNTLKSCADWLQQKTNRYSPRKRKIILILFCSVLISESTVVVYQSFKKEDANFYSVTPIQAVPLFKEKTVQPAVNEKEFKRIHSLRVYLDSLQNTTQGKLKFDSLLSTWPHILDTIHYLENIYYEQQTNRK